MLVAIFREIGQPGYAAFLYCQIPDMIIPLLYHHEGLSKGHSFNKTEIQRMYDVWGDMLYDNEYYSKKFTRWSEYPVYGLMEPRYPWEKTIE